MTQFVITINWSYVTYAGVILGSMVFGGAVMLLLIKGALGLRF